MAEAFGVTPRTLRNWQRLDPAEQRARPGRPRLSQLELDWVREAVREQLELQGWGTGEKSIHRALSCVVPISRVRLVLRELKAARRKHLRRRREQSRVSVKVCARDAVWSTDATHLGRDEAERDVQGEIVRDVASTRSIGIAVGPPATGADVVRLLERTKRERGGAPLVLLSDNGPQYRSSVVAKWCLDNLVLHLYSLPHTPQHNAASEHGMRELKEDAALGKGTLVLDIDEARALLERSRDRIDGNKLRATRNWMTAVEADRRAPHWSELVDRDELWMKATCAIAKALLNSTGARARRRAVREAVLATLAHFSVIIRTRGGRPWTVQDAEDVL